MNKEPDFFSNITPTSGGLIIIALGVLLLIGAIRRWKWVFDMTGERNKGFNFLLFCTTCLATKG
ncbi:Imm17 family immunity protein [Bacteroides thetaiotaomicron]|nr:Imm17 family immunity protein [Bacteroides thetaiotaomicron]MCS2715994.1 Imm17 family immunity protein [Bacteroides thetaiotaomicron]